MGNQMFAVADKTGKKQYFDLKVPAKTHRDKLVAEGFKGAHVTFGPDHPLHHSNRETTSWNKGRHPKASWKGKNKTKEFRRLMHG